MTSNDFALPAGEPTSTDRACCSAPASTAPAAPPFDMAEIVAPVHYTRGGIGATEFTEAYSLNPRLTAVVQYIARHRSKGGTKDLLKAAWNLCREIVLTEGPRGVAALDEIVRSLAAPSEKALMKLELNGALALADEWKSSALESDAEKRESAAELAKEQEKHRRAESLIVELQMQLRATKKTAAGKRGRK